MKRIYNLSIRHKLILIISLVTTLSLGVSLTISAVHDILSFRKELVEESVLEANLVGNYCIAPLVFGDKLGAVDILNKSLEIPEVKFCRLYNMDGSEFASSSKIEGPISFMNLPNNLPMTQFKDGYIHVFQPVNYQDQQYGSIYIIRSTKMLNNKIRNHVIIMFLILSAAIILAISVASRLQSTISEPILKLASFTDKISKEADYSLRIQKQSKDEIGSLYDGINNMLEQIHLQQVERDRAEAALTESEKKYRNLVDNALVGIYSSTLEGEILYVNNAMVRLFEFDSPEELISEGSLARYKNPDDREILLKHIKKAGKVEDYELEFLTKTGKVLNMLVNTLLEGNVLSGMFMDITERKRAEQISKKAEAALKEYSEHLEEMVEERTKELRDAQEELLSKERLAVLGKISGSIAHEIRNPLGVIDSSVYYLKTILSDADEKTKLHLDRIKNQVGISTAIIESLRNMTEMEEPQTRQIDIVKVIKNSMQICKIPQNIKVTLQIPEGKFFVKADVNQLTIVFNNIITNAIQATDIKGTLLVTAKITNEKNIEISFQDTGSGIAPENMRKIFQPFFSTKATGIGFGLVICEMIIEKHGGSIEARSETGKGATFIIQLPMADTVKDRKT